MRLLRASSPPRSRSLTRAEAALSGGAGAPGRCWVSIRAQVIRQSGRGNSGGGEAQLVCQWPTCSHLSEPPHSKYPPPVWIYGGLLAPAVVTGSSRKFLWEKGEKGWAAGMLRISGLEAALRSPGVPLSARLRPPECRLRATEE